MTTKVDDKNESHISTAKKIKLSSSSDDFKSEGSNEDVLTETESKKVELIFPNSSLSPEDCVLSIDHIRESIFLYCDRETLMTCRLVSRRWAYYGSKALQKTGLITLPGSFSRPGEPPIVQSDSDKSQFMKNLIALINNSNEFPASSFYLHNWQIEGENTAQSFFDAHGALIKKIIIKGNLWVDELKQLILIQAPNLEELHLRNVLIMNRNYLQNLDPTAVDKQRLEESLFDETLATGSKPILKALKVLKCSFSIMPKVLMRQILECSQNLVQVTLPEKCLHFLVQPANRLHLLRKLELKIESRSIESVEAVANHCHEGNWGVRELRYLGGARFDVENVTQFDQRVASIMNKILSVSSTTCQKLQWCEHPKNFRIPVMPKVEQLTFLYYENEETGYPVNIMPEGVSFADTFPNLQWLKIRSWECMKDLLIENIFGGNTSVPVPSVKKVVLRFYKFRDRLRQSFQRMFPNATICNKFYDNDRVRNEYGQSFDDNSSDSDSDELCGYVSDDEISDSEFYDYEINDNEINDNEINDNEINDEGINDGEFNYNYEVNVAEIHNDEDEINNYDSNDERFDDERNYDAFSDDESNEERYL